MPSGKPLKNESLGSWQVSRNNSSHLYWHLPIASCFVPRQKRLPRKALFLRFLWTLSSLMRCWRRYITCWLLCGVSGGVEAAVRASSLIKQKATPDSIFLGRLHSHLCASGKDFLLQLFFYHLILFSFPDIYSFTNQRLEVLLLNESKLIFCVIDSVCSPKIHI